MKHQALARVFAIVLAVMCVVMLLAGAIGLRNAFNDKESDDSALELLRSRTASAEELRDILAESESYAELSERLDENMEQHEEESAQHRTDLATYSATRGGTKMGADKLWDAKAQAESGRAQLEAGMERLEQGEAAYALYQSAVGLSSACRGYAGELGNAAGILNGAVSAVAALDPADPDYAASAANLMGVAQTDAQAALTNNDAYNGTKDSVAALLSQLAAMSGAGFDASLFPANLSVTVNTADMPGTMRSILTSQGTFATLADRLDAFTAASGMDASTGATLAATRAQLEQAKAKLDSGEQQIQSNLELIWYQNGELEKDAAELEEKKNRLSSELEELSELEAKAEEQKENEKKFSSLCVLLKKNANINAAVAAGGDIIESAKAEAESFAGSLKLNFILRLVLCGISILGALAGFLSIPAAFEKTKSRALLILPVALCLVCALVAVGLSFFMGRGALYSAIFTAPFALAQLLIVSPKKAK